MSTRYVKAMNITESKVSVAKTLQSIVKSIKPLNEFADLAVKLTNHLPILRLNPISKS